MVYRPTIMKFGGTSVEDADAFVRVSRIVLGQMSVRPVVVVSAMSGVTDALLASVRTAASVDARTAARSLEEHLARHEMVARSLLKTDAVDFIASTIENARREIYALLESVAQGRMPRALLQDVIVSYGERLSATLLAKVFETDDISARYVEARRCILTNDEHGNAQPLNAETSQRTRAELEPLIADNIVPVLGGFIGATTSGQTTTLGRGGSDYTAALVGAALDVREIQIWTDVTGVLTADPRVVKQARTIARLSYNEAAELAYFGAKVLHPKTIQPAVERNIPVRICNSRAPEETGTLVCAETETTPHTVKAIAHKTGVTTVQVTSARMLGAYGFLRALFEVFERHRTVVDVVTTSEVSVSLSLDDASTLPAIIAELKKFGAVEIEKGRAIICVVGEGLRTTPGIAARAFNQLKDINISLISQGASSINLTFAVDEERAIETVTRLHEAFFNESEVQSPKFKVTASALDGES